MRVTPKNIKLIILPDSIFFLSIRDKFVCDNNNLIYHIVRSVLCKIPHHLLFFWNWTAKSKKPNANFFFSFFEVKTILPLFNASQSHLLELTITNLSARVRVINLLHHPQITIKITFNHLIIKHLISFLISNNFCIFLDEFPNNAICNWLFPFKL